MPHLIALDNTIVIDYERKAYLEFFDISFLNKLLLNRFKPQKYPF